MSSLSINCLSTTFFTMLLLFGVNTRSFNPSRTRVTPTYNCPWAKTSSWFKSKPTLSSVWPTIQYSYNIYYFIHLLNIYLVICLWLIQILASKEIVSLSILLLQFGDFFPLRHIQTCI